MITNDAACRLMEQQPPVWIRQDSSGVELDNDYVHQQQQLINNNEPPPPVVMCNRQRRTLWRTCLRSLTHISRIRDRSKRADYLSRIIFPTLFLVFNIIYWTNYSRYQISDTK